MPEHLVFVICIKQTLMGRVHSRPRFKWCLMLVSSRWKDILMDLAVSCFYLVVVWVGWRVVGWKWTKVKEQWRWLGCFLTFLCMYTCGWVCARREWPNHPHIVLLDGKEASGLPGLSRKSQIGSLEQHSPPGLGETLSLKTWWQNIYWPSHWCMDSLCCHKALYSCFVAACTNGMYLLLTHILGRLGPLIKLRNDREKFSPCATLLL